jgi:hypothetical protein
MAEGSVANEGAYFKGCQARSLLGLARNDLGAYYELAVFCKKKPAVELSEEIQKKLRVFGLLAKDGCILPDVRSMVVEVVKDQRELLGRAQEAEEEYGFCQNTLARVCPLPRRRKIREEVESLEEAMKLARTVRSCSFGELAVCVLRARIAEQPVMFFLAEKRGG